MRDNLIQPATAEQVTRFCERTGLAVEAARQKLAAMREKSITARRSDPFNYGYEPEIWLVVKSLLRNGAPDEMEISYVKKHFNSDWAGFAERIRTRLGFAHPVSEVLLMGANRSGKTDFCAKYAMKLCRAGGKNVYVGFQSLSTGKDVQEPRIWNYMPLDWRAKNVALAKAKDTEEHISYTKQNGFASSKITFGNKSNVRFISYEMDPHSVFEGQSLHFVWLDEEFGMEFLASARYRLADTRGDLICSFTPVKGYTPVVAEYLKDMQVVRWHTAYMLPKDLGEPLPWKELGLEKEEYENLIAWRNEGAVGDIGIPESRPEPVAERILHERAGDDFAEAPRGRAFESVPRIGLAHGGDAAVVWFYGRDNPYGNPAEVIKKAAQNKNATKEIKTRVYGIAERIAGRMFPEFSRARHVIRAEEVPEDVLRIQVVDPAPERNWTFAYFGWHPKSGTLYLYREWPGSYEIPGVGYPGEWAVLSDRKMGVNDGDRGPATEPFDFGFLGYKAEWARLEGWHDWEEWANNQGPMTPCKDFEQIEQWSEVDGVGERMEFRVIDARAAAQSKMAMRENVSLFDDVSRLAEGFTPASGQQIGVGVNIIRDLLSRNRFKIVESCQNSIFAMETYCGSDGQKGACKDFVDLMRYAVLSGICDYTEAMIQGGQPNNIGKVIGESAQAPRGGGGRKVWW